MNTQSGPLLFTAPSLTRRVEYLLAVAAAIGVGGSFLDAYIKFWNFKTMVGAVLATLLFAAATFRRLRHIEFYENGIFFPDQQDDPKDRFIRWDEIVRSYWEGDVLTVIPSSSVLTAGGEPLTGGSVKVPKARRAEVERLLAAGGGRSIARGCH